MSHYHCEIVMPPTDDVEAAVTKALARFDKARLDQFNAWMKETKVMVMGITCGKQELADAETVRRVDAKWNEMFPEHPGACPLFQHANNQYDSKSTIAGDVCKLSEVPAALACSRVIFVGNDGEPEFMLADSFWNGVTWEDHKWRGLFAEALAEYRKRLSSYKQEWRAANEATDDWLVITVDYHS